MTRLACLILLGFAACNDEPPRFLADVSSSLEIQFGASPVLARVEIHSYSPAGCLILHESFRATINGAGMRIEHRGSGDRGIDCLAPLLLSIPPTAERSTLELADESMAITIDLEDLVAPRTIQLVPDGPWILETGATVTARYAPEADLHTGGAMLGLRSSSGSLSGYFPLTASGDQLSFVVPDKPGAWLLELYPDMQLRSWSCQDVECRIQRTQTIAQPIEIRRPATM